MIKFTKERALSVHHFLKQQTGGDDGVRDPALLESALESAYVTFGGVDLYPSREEKAARLCASIIGNHPFVDGNKRAGVYIMLAFLEVNGINLSCSDADLISLGIGVADGSMQYEDVLNWISIRRSIAVRLM